MVHDWKMELYWRLPVRLQELSLSFFAWRLDRLYYGGEFESACRQVRERVWRSAEEIADWQLGRLNEVLSTAVRRVPHYRAISRRLGLGEIRSHADLSRLPLLDRHEIRQREPEFLDERLDRRRLFQDKTSGSTGSSLSIYWPTAPLQRFWATFEIRVREQAGVSRGVPRAMLGGRPVVRGDASRPPYWRRNSFWRQLYLSSYHVSVQNASVYVQAIKKSGARWITGYGSAIAALAESATAAGIGSLPMQVAVVSGDTLQRGMRHSIERFFQCRCYDSYGQVEGVAMAMECSEGRLHLVPEVGIVEIVRADGSPCEPGEVGEIVGSGLINDGMPLLRYRTGDYAAWAAIQECPCGQHHPVIESLEGRVDDYLETRDGRRIGRLSTAMKRSPTIHSAQIVQDQPGHAYLLVRPGQGYRSQDASAVRDDIVERIGHFDIEIREVAEIPKSPKGKTRLVVRLSDRPDLQREYEPVLTGRNADRRMPA